MSKFLKYFAIFCGLFATVKLSARWGWGRSHWWGPGYYYEPHPAEVVSGVVSDAIVTSAILSNSRPKSAAELRQEAEEIEAAGEARAAVNRAKNKTKLQNKLSSSQDELLRLTESLAKSSGRKKERLQTKIAGLEAKIHTLKKQIDDAE